MRVLALSLLTALVLAPAGGGAPRTAITPAQARTADVKIGLAIKKEREALARVGTRAVLPHVYLYASIEDLGEARTILRGAADTASIVNDLSDAVSLDHDAIAHQSVKGHARILDDIRKALVLKKRAQAALAPHEIGATSCESEKDFPLYGVPAGYAGAYTDVYPHHVPRDAQNIQIRFVDQATGHPAPKEPFPGQTWKAKIVGFETRGGETVLHVHIDVTGPGHGTNESVNWRILVTWDC